VKDLKTGAAVATETMLLYFLEILGTETARTTQVKYVKQMQVSKN
jgi:hypothetical protein